MGSEGIFPEAREDSRKGFFGYGRGAHMGREERLVVLAGIAVIEKEHDAAVGGCSDDAPGGLQAKPAVPSEAAGWGQGMFFQNRARAAGRDVSETGAGRIWGGKSAW